jgi:hypothetical protein
LLFSLPTSAMSFFDNLNFDRKGVTDNAMLENVVHKRQQVLASQQQASQGT